MEQDQPGLTLVILDSNQSNRLIVQARYLPEESLIAQDQRVDGVKVEVLESHIPDKTEDSYYFVIEYQVTNENTANIDATFFDMALEDGNGQRYTPNDAATSWGKYGRLTRILTYGESATGSVGYQIPRAIQPPVTWIVRSDPTSANSTRFTIPYTPPQPGPPAPNVELSSVFNDGARNVIVIDGVLSNNGESPLVVTLANVNLTSGNGNGTLQTSTPLLPWTVAANAYQEFELQFSRPTGVDSALLEIVGFTFRIEGLE